MHFNSKLILLVAATLPSTLAAVNGRCSGRSGICIATGTCNRYGGTYYSGKCPNDANDIRCCDNIPCKADDGRPGNCIFADQCSGDKISGKCPGGSDFKCCVSKKQDPIGTSCSYDGLSGTCQYDNNCSGGFTVSGQCPGASNIKCCIPKKQCSDGRSSGSCLPTNQCNTGYTVSNQCPGGSTIKCCLPKPDPIGTACSYDGLSGTCQYDNNCSGGFTVSGQCPGASNIKCCIPKKQCSDGRSSGSCIPKDQCSTGNTVSNQCPGGNSIKCCLPKQEQNPNNIIGTKCTYDKLDGTCQYDNNCGGNSFTVSGQCPGPSNIKCCIPKKQCSDGKGASGVCIPTDQCSTGNTVSNQCPGGNSIKCCLSNNNNTSDNRCPNAGGQCMNPDTCRSQGGTVLDNLCPGKNDNKCCVPNNNTTDTRCPSAGGQCMNPDTCRSQGGTVLDNLCPGKNDNKCCVRNNQNGNGNCTKFGGQCMNPNSCNGKVQDGLCPGDNSNKCCIPSGTSCTDVKGQCMRTSNCGGTVLKGLCPGDDNNRCCVQDGSNSNPITTPGNNQANPDDFVCLVLGGQCMNQNSCNGKVQTGLCSGGNDRKCCLPPGTTCQGVGGQCGDPDRCRNLGGGVVRRSIEGGGIILDGLCPGNNRNKCCVPLSTLGTNPTNDTPSNNNKKCTIVRQGDKEVINCFVPLNYHGSGNGIDNISEKCKKYYIKDLEAKLEDGTAKRIWHFFMGKINNKHGVAGLMGNLFIESQFNPKRVQYSYDKKAIEQIINRIKKMNIGETIENNMSREEFEDMYARITNSGKYYNVEKSGDKGFIDDENGYGLGQWTVESRKQDLYDYIKKGEISLRKKKGCEDEDGKKIDCVPITSYGNINSNIGDFQLQLEFIWTELTRTDYEGTNEKFNQIVTPYLKKATSYEDATERVVKYFGPSKPNSEGRVCSSEIFYKIYNDDVDCNPSIGNYPNGYSCGPEVDGKLVGTCYSKCEGKLIFNKYDGPCCSDGICCISFDDFHKILW